MWCLYVADVDFGEVLVLSAWLTTYIPVGEEEAGAAAT